MSESRPEGLGISELAVSVGVTPRTIRYYVAEGLLPPPGGGGQHRVYTQEHLLRLQAIGRLKEAYLPLGEIRRRLGGASLEELRQIAESPAQPPSSALDYVNSVLSAQLSANATAELSKPPAASGPPPAPSGTVWQRVLLAPGVELHYQLTDDPNRDAAIARLIAEGARLLSGPPPDQERR